MIQFFIDWIFLRNNYKTFFYWFKTARGNMINSALYPSESNELGTRDSWGTIDFKYTVTS